MGLLNELQDFDIVSRDSNSQSSFNIDMSELTDGEDMIEPIDMEAITDEALVDAQDMVENISKFYYNEEFMKANPQLKKRIDLELESLRVLIKMRKADEVTHDILMKAISGNSGNASLYRALSELQKTILQITTKMLDTVTGLNTVLKNYQLEFNFAPHEDELELNDLDSESDEGLTTRGAKDFILKMQEKKEP